MNLREIFRVDAGCLHLIQNPAQKLLGILKSDLTDRRADTGHGMSQRRMRPVGSGRLNLERFLCGQIDKVHALVWGKAQLRVFDLLDQTVKL